MSDKARVALALAKMLQEAAPKSFVPPSEGTRPENESILPFVIVKGTRGYIEKVTNQVNGCYGNAWFDGCAVMMRRMLETLIIECFEAHGIADRIKDSSGQFFYLSGLIDAALSEKTWNLGRGAARGLSRLKDIGDRSAHSRRYNAVRDDIDKVSDDFRVACEELLYVAKLK